MGVNATSFFTDHNRFYFINQEQHDALDSVWQMILPCLGFFPEVHNWNSGNI